MPEESSYSPEELPEKSRYRDEMPPKSDSSDSESESALESVLESTKQSLRDKGSFPMLVEFVRSQRLPSKFSFENLSELVRCILKDTRLKNLSVDFEECVSWIANCLFEDPVANQRAESLWNAIINQIQMNND